MTAKYELERARQSGRWMRDAHKERSPPFYAMGLDGLELRKAWLAGTNETSRSGGSGDG